MKKVILSINRMNHHVGVFVGLIVIPIELIISYEVVSSYFFNAPTIWANQLTQLIFGGYLLMGGAYTLLYDGHIRMDVVYNHITSKRTRAAVDAVTFGLFFMFCVILLQQSIPVVWQATLARQTTPDILWNPPIWPTYWALPVSTVLLMLQGLVKFADVVSIAIKGRPLYE